MPERLHLRKGQYRLGGDDILRQHTALGGAIDMRDDTTGAGSRRRMEHTKPDPVLKVNGPARNGICSTSGSGRPYRMMLDVSMRDVCPLLVSINRALRNARAGADEIGAIDRRKHVCGETPVVPTPCLVTVQAAQACPLPIAI
jgi:hypothetical protein